MWIHDKDDYEQMYDVIENGKTLYRRGYLVLTLHQQTTALIPAIQSSCWTD